MVARRRWRKLMFLLLAILVAVGAVLAYSLAEAYRVELKEFTFTSSDLPEEFDGTRIILLTDIHRSWYFSQSRVASLVDRVNGLEPDLVVLGGDYVYKNTDYEASCFVELSRLEAPLGCFAVLGNHDYGEHDDRRGENPSKAVEAVADAGITLLDNQAIWIEKAGAQIRLGGVEDKQTGNPEVGPTIEEASADDFILLVSHNPDVAEELPKGTIDLMLSGHTHGGQITFFGLWAPSIPSSYGQKYRTGAIVTETTTVIVSNGIGTIFPPLRFFAPPQIVEITLRSGPATDLQP